VAGKRPARLAAGPLFLRETIVDASFSVERPLPGKVELVARPEFSLRRHRSRLAYDTSHGRRTAPGSPQPGHAGNPDDQVHPEQDGPDQRHGGNTKHLRGR
jgi:hypothetical protein